ncbi:phosphoribosylaminoimidazolesuccinocarboxamide synthase [Treponema lecithinolyticum ATCC 700332]|jgi:Phosphoribosylaminoimidazolesuccinocarboxamide (SAICAR) synthase|uniref:Phosphoribosylaminoimidazole-succinocarboxamide synthase n=2 Tax=Treponema lecithinolyticum TaxID=53418 RepID=A0ABN0P0V7_TRELE|nr:phosphoribosylaminoimidazolesuccinocarboxamide synthase [Treponema lecithinolyticum ATCC 700332]
MFFMEKIYTGKTKDIYRQENGNYVLKFKDDVTGENGVFDPGANTVGLSIEGVGKEGLKITRYFFEILKSKGIKTHYIDSNIDENTMTVLPAKVFGKGLEVICRFKAVGSFVRRYGAYVSGGEDLDTYVEFTLKDDGRGDPLITKDALIMLGILSETEYEQIVALTKKICTIIKDVLHEKGLTLYDIKLEFGRVKDEVVLIDEISGGNMRVYKGTRTVAPTELYSFLCA